MEIIERYNFKYEKVKNKINYELPSNDKIIKNIESFYSLIKDYKNNILFKNYFYQGSNSADLKYKYILNKYGAQKKDNMLKISDQVKKDDKKINKKYDLINKLELLLDEDKTRFEYKSIIHTIDQIFKNLNNKGYFFFNIIKFDSNMIKLVNLLLLLFDHIYYYSDCLLCFEFNPIINEEKFNDLLKNIENVEITPLISSCKFPSIGYILVSIIILLNAFLIEISPIFFLANEYSAPTNLPLKLFHNICAILF